MQRFILALLVVIASTLTASQASANTTQFVSMTFAEPTHHGDCRALHIAQRLLGAFDGTSGTTAIFTPWAGRMFRNDPWLRSARINYASVSCIRHLTVGGSSEPSDKPWKAMVE